MSTTVTNVTNPLASIAAQAAPASAGALATGDAQDRFLKLLVTQLKNQDPLNPMDNAQITTQMAQISTVSGIDKLNTTLQSMAVSFGTGQSLQATAMIGHNVLAAGNTMQLQDGTALGGIALPQAADSVVVSVRDASGLVLHKVNLGAQEAGVVSFQWDGVTDSGASATPGSYSFSVEAMQGGNKVEATALALGRVGSVSQANGTVQLNIDGQGPVALADIKRVM